MGIRPAQQPVKEPSPELVKRIHDYIARKGRLYAPVDHPAFASLPTKWKRDRFELFKPYLVPGALLLMHDVLGTHYGSLRVFAEDVLGSDDFGPAGYCGSIGWIQYRPLDGDKLRYRIRRRLLAVPARQIIPVAKSALGLEGWNKLRYKLWRPLAPHGRMTPEKLWSRIRGV